MLRGLVRLVERLRGLRELPTFTQVAGAGFDPALVGVGGSPWGAPVDPTADFLEVPPAPSAPGNRYLFRLASVPIPAGKAARLLAVGEYTEIGATLPTVQPGGSYRAPLQVVTAGWGFQDANIARGLSVCVNSGNRIEIVDPGQTPSTSPNLFDISPALLYVPSPAGPVPYVAPNGGRWPGSPVPGLEIWRGRRFQWGQGGAPLDYAIEGPCDLVYWASVKQTDPQTRGVPSLTPEQVAALCPEDRFVYNFPGSTYTRIGGFLVVEIGPTSRDARRLGEGTWQEEIASWLT